MKRLTIVVPYRDRAAHLGQFVPHLRAYFARDKLDRQVPYRVLIIEQDASLPFNRGALNNIGFLLGQGHGDYTCFHDVDYLPIWADYSWTPVPTPIVWYGAGKRPVAPGRSHHFVKHDLELFFGAVVLTPNEAFSSVNGYSNDYWGWGFEDVDLRARFVTADIEIGRRRGTFAALDHDNQGFTLNGRQSPIFRVNQGLFEQKLKAAGRPVDDGLSTVAFEILERRAIPERAQAERTAPWEIVTVRLNMQPRSDQLEAVNFPSRERPQST